MVTLHLYNNQDIVINPMHILLIEQIPETLITLTSGQKVRVKNSLHDVLEKVTDYFRFLGLGGVMVISKYENLSVSSDTKNQNTEAVKWI